MTIEQFAALQENEFFHDTERGDEWRVLENKEHRIKSTCTKTGKWFNEGDTCEWNKDMGECTSDYLKQYSIGKNPKQAAQ